VQSHFDERLISDAFARGNLARLFQVNFLKANRDLDAVLFGDGRNQV
jgi:hypothetical protein